MRRMTDCSVRMGFPGVYYKEEENEECPFRMGLKGVYYKQWKLQAIHQIIKRKKT